MSIKLNPKKIYTNYELRELAIYGVIYKITNDINDKVYVGKTVDLRERSRGRIFEVKSNQTVANSGIVSAMREMGLNKFHYEIIDYLEIHSDFKYSNKELYEEELSNKEVYWIKKLNTLDQGYNQTEGGEGIYNYTTSVIQYDIEGNFIQEWDSIKSANIVLNVNSNSVSGIPRVCLGLSKIAFGYQWHYKQSNKFPLKIPPAPSDYWILQYDKLGNFLNEYRSPTFAAKIIGVENGGGKISECARNNYMITAYGFQWRYKEDDNFTKNILSAEEQNGLLKHYAKTAKPVIQYDLDGNFISTYRTTDEAEEKTGVSRVTIQKVASGEYHHAGNYQWKYKTLEKIPKKIDAYNNPHTKEIFQYEYPSGKLLNIWKSARKACEKNPKWDFKQMSSAALGSQNTYLNFVWSYEKLNVQQVMEKGTPKTKSKPVYQYSKDRETLIAKFESATIAAKKLGYNNSDGITRVARGDRTHYKGYYFSYKKL